MIIKIKCNSIFKRAGFLALFVLCFFRLIAQNQPYKLDTVIFMPKIKYSHVFLDYTVKIAFWNNFLAICYKHKNKIIFEKYNFKGKLLALKKLKIPKDFDQLTSLDFNGKYIAIADHYQTYLYKNNSQTAHLKLNTNRSMKTELVSNFIFSYYFYHYHPNDAKYGIAINKFDYNGNLIDTFRDNISALCYTMFFPYKHIDISDSLIYIAQINKYQIDVYNYNFEKIDSLKNNNIKWASPDILITNIVDRDPNRKWLFKDAFNEQFYYKMNKIDHVQHLDSGKLLVRYFEANPTKNKKYKSRMINIFKFNGSEYDLIDTFRETNMPGNENIQYGFPIFSEVNNYTRYYKNRVIQLRFSSTVYPHQNLNWKEYEKQNKDQMVKENPIISLWIFSPNNL